MGRRGGGRRASHAPAQCRSCNCSSARGAEGQGNTGEPLQQQDQQQLRQEWSSRSSSSGGRHCSGSCVCLAVGNGSERQRRQASGRHGAPREVAPREGEVGAPWQVCARGTRGLDFCVWRMDAGWSRRPAKPPVGCQSAAVEANDAWAQQSVSGARREKLQGGCHDGFPGSVPD